VEDDCGGLPEPGTLGSPRVRMPVGGPGSRFSADRQDDEGSDPWRTEELQEGNTSLHARPPGRRQRARFRSDFFNHARGGCNRSHTTGSSVAREGTGEHTRFSLAQFLSSWPFARGSVRRVFPDQAGKRLIFFRFSSKLSAQAILSPQACAWCAFVRSSPENIAPHP
jgi:hypothetical protein